MFALLYLIFQKCHHTHPIDNQFAEIVAALNGLNDPLSNEVVVNNAQGHETYDKLQQLVPLIKVDMTSALGVLITYQDNDGD